MPETIRNRRSRIRLWLWWVLVTAAGGAVLGALSAPTDFFWYTLMSGFVVGLAQWLVLRFYIQQAFWWVVASAFGWFVGINVSIMAKEVLAPIVKLLLSIGGLWEVFWLNIVNNPVIFAWLGVTQWLVLRRHARYAGWWIVATAISGAVYGAVSSAVCAVACQVGGGALSYGAGWASNGAFTGIMLVWLLQDSVRIQRQR